MGFAFLGGNGGVGEGCVDEAENHTKKLDVALWSRFRKIALQHTPTHTPPFLSPRERGLHPKKEKKERAAKKS